MQLNKLSSYKSIISEDIIIEEQLYKAYPGTLLSFRTPFLFKIRQ